MTISLFFHGLGGELLYVNYVSILHISVWWQAPVVIFATD